MFLLRPGLHDQRRDTSRKVDGDVQRMVMLLLRAACRWSDGYIVNRGLHTEKGDESEESGRAIDIYTYLGSSSTSFEPLC